MPQLLSLQGLESVSLSYWAHAPQQEKPPQWDTRAAKHSTCLLQLEKAYVQWWMHCAGKNEYIQFFESQVNVIIEVLRFPGKKKKISWRREWQPTPVLLPGKSCGLRSLVGYSPWGRKESDTTEQLHFSS